MVRIHPDPPGNDLAGFAGGCSSAGRAPALQAGGRRFDPDQLHQRCLAGEARSEKDAGCVCGFTLPPSGFPLHRVKKVRLFFNNLEEVCLVAR